MPEPQRIDFEQLEWEDETGQAHRGGNLAAGPTRLFLIDDPTA